MGPSKTLCFALVLSSLGFVSPVFADDTYRTKTGFDIRGYKPNTQSDVGWSVGGRWARYFGSSQVYMGLGAYFGAPTGLSIGEQRTYYGGLILGYDGRLSKYFIYEFGVLLGYGEGSMRSLSINEKSYYVAEPTLAVGFALGGGWRIAFSGSYVHMTTARNFCGPTFGVRFQYRSGSAIKDIND